MSNISDTRFACQVGNYMTTTVDNKMYVTGGYNLVCNVTDKGCVNDTPAVIANNDLLAIDFTKQFTWDPRDVGTRTRMPAKMPDVSWGTLWGVGGKLYQFGGNNTEGYPAETLSGARAASPRPSVERSVWEYDIATDVWEETPQTTNWGGVVEPVVQGAAACGGGDVCYLLIGKTTRGMDYEGSLLAYDVKQKTWLDMRDVNGTMDRVYGARMLYVEALDSLVVVGGVMVGSDVPRDMKTISLFNIPNKTWYTVQATGTQTTSRINFCAAAASAEDGSSHNIYIFGGTAQGEIAAPSSSGKINMWVLTMPRFTYHALPYAVAPGREGLSCALIDKRYVVTFSGKQRLLKNGCDTSTKDGVMWDAWASTWTGVYQAPVDAAQVQYRVPKELIEVIGGTQDGGANATEPVGGFLDPGLQAIFDAAVSPPRSTDIEAGKTTPTGAIAGGVVGGVVALVVVALLVWWIRRNKSRGVTTTPVQPEMYHDGVMGQQHNQEGTTQVKVEAPAVEVAGELDSRRKYEMLGSTPLLELEGSRVELDRGRWRSQ